MVRMMSGEFSTMERNIAFEDPSLLTTAPLPPPLPLDFFKEFWTTRLQSPAEFPSEAVPLLSLLWAVEAVAISQLN